MHTLVREPPRAVAIVAFDEAQILDIAGPMEILRAANLALEARRSTSAPVYEMAIVARARGLVRTSCGLAIVATDSFATDSFATARRDVDTLIVRSVARLFTRELGMSPARFIERSRAARAWAARSGCAAPGKPR